MAAAEGFTYETRRAGEVVIRHRGRIATVLRGRAATRFLADTEREGVDLQGRMARLTGNYKHGNERRTRAR